jgi:hypothetical protein
VLKEGVEDNVGPEVKPNELVALGKDEIDAAEEDSEVDLK